MKLTDILYFNKSAKFLREKSDFLNQSLIDLHIDTLKDLSSLDGSEIIESNNVDLFKNEVL